MEPTYQDRRGDTHPNNLTVASREKFTEILAEVNFDILFRRNEGLLISIPHSCMKDDASKGCHVIGDRMCNFTPIYDRQAQIQVSKT